jgi:hypothetical protein
MAMHPPPARQPASPPARQPASPPARQPASPPARQHPIRLDITPPPPLPSSILIVLDPGLCTCVSLLLQMIIFFL